MSQAIFTKKTIMMLLGVSFIISLLLSFLYIFPIVIHCPPDAICERVSLRGVILVFIIVWIITFLVLLLAYYLYRRLFQKLSPKRGKNEI
jgi:hypothetical protein